MAVLIELADVLAPSDRATRKARWPWRRTLGRGRRGLTTQLLVATLLLVAAPGWARKPYPDAYGFGAKAQVGLAAGPYTVYSVTNTNDSGAGSARACLEATGNRICVVETGGTVELMTTIRITSPHVYFAATHAPGGGLQFTRAASYNGYYSGVTGVISPTSGYVTHIGIWGATDVVIRNVRFRHSDPVACTHGPPDPSCHWEYSVAVSNASDRVLLDQISSAWATEDALDLGTMASIDGPYDITVQRSIVGQPMYVKDAFYPGIPSARSEYGHAIASFADRTSVIRNYMAGSIRFPNLDGGGPQEAINNVAWALADSQGYTVPLTDCAGVSHTPLVAKYVGNTWAKPASNGTNLPPVLLAKQRNCTGDNHLGCDGLGAWFSGNRSWKNMDASAAQSNHYLCADQGNARTGDMGCAGDVLFGVYPCITPTDLTLTKEPFTSYSSPPIMPATETARIIAAAGATPRDAVDTCLAGLYGQANGTQIETVAAGCNGGPEALAAGTWCSSAGGDTDADAMCDNWERTLFGDLSHTGSTDTDHDGWSDLEEFLNGTSPLSSDALPAADAVPAAPTLL